MFWALRGVSFRIQRGEVVGIIGRNGSGKSTLLRVICGIYGPDRGSVMLPTGRVSALLELGSGFRDELSGMENIRLACAIQGFSSSEIDAIIEPIISFSGIEEFIDQPIRTYSSGMKARLGFAVASVVEPDVLLIDEVLAVGDAGFRQRCMTRIEQLVAGDTTVVVVSHNTAELERLCSRLILLERGIVIMDGAVKDVLERYQQITAST